MHEFDRSITGRKDAIHKTGGPRYLTLIIRRNGRLQIRSFLVAYRLLTADVTAMPDTLALDGLLAEVQPQTPRSPHQGTYRTLSPPRG